MPLGVSLAIGEAFRSYILVLRLHLISLRFRIEPGLNQTDAIRFDLYMLVHNYTAILKKYSVRDCHRNLGDRYISIRCGNERLYSVVVIHSLQIATGCLAKLQHNFAMYSVLSINVH